MFGRGRAKTRGELVRAEFGESLEHLRKAVHHAAGGVGASVGPRYGSARNRYGSARDSAKNKVNSARGFVSPGTTRMTNAASHGWDSTIAALAPLMEAARQGSERAAKLPPAAGRRNMLRRGKVKVKVETENGHTGAVVGLIAAGAAIGATTALVARRRNRAKWAEYEPSAIADDADAMLAKTRGGEHAAGEGASGKASKVVSWARGTAGSAVGNVKGKIHSATADGEHQAGAARTRGSEGAGHLGDKGEARTNDAAGRRGSTSDAGNRASDEVDEMLRSSRNGRM